MPEILITGDLAQHLRERLVPKNVGDEDGCWLDLPKAIRIDGVSVRTRRLIYVLYRKKPPIGDWIVSMTCPDPWKRIFCCNPDHMRRGDRTGTSCVLGSMGYN